jgi:hypothetical protein
MEKCDRPDRCRNALRGVLDQCYRRSHKLGSGFSRPTRSRRRMWRVSCWETSLGSWASINPARDLSHITLCGWRHQCPKPNRHHRTTGSRDHDQRLPRMAAASEGTAYSSRGDPSWPASPSPACFIGSGAAWKCAAEPDFAGIACRAWKAGALTAEGHELADTDADKFTLPSSDRGRAGPRDQQRAKTRHRS